MRDLKKEINLDTILHLSASMYIHRIILPSQDAVYSSFLPKKGYTGSRSLYDPKNTNASHAGMKFKVTNVRDVASKVTKHFSFRVVEIAQDI
jgi:hypothetical protein